jgi:hypothetical protein
MAHLLFPTAATVYSLLGCYTQWRLVVTDILGQTISPSLKGSCSPRNVLRTAGFLEVGTDKFF